MRLMAPKPMPVRTSKPGLKNVSEYWNFRNGSIFLLARFSSREMAVVSNPFQPAFSVWVTSQSASIHQTAPRGRAEVWSSALGCSWAPQKQPVPARPEKGAHPDTEPPHVLSDRDFDVKLRSTVVSLLLLFLNLLCIRRRRANGIRLGLSAFL